MLKASRWLVLSTIVLAGCGLIPTASEPTRPPAAPAGTSTAAPASGPASPPASATASKPAVPPSPSPSPSPSPIPRVTLRIGTSPSLGGWILDVAEERGYLAAQGIVLDRKSAEPGAATVAEDVDKRERDVGVVTTDRLIQVGKNGQGLVMVAGLINKSPHTLIGGRDVPDFAALKGSPIGHLDARSASAALLKRMLKAKNVPENEAPLLTFPDPGVVGAAITNGTVGASLVDPVRFGRLRGSGFPLLAEASEVARDFQAEGLVVRPEWARQNEDLLVRLLRATIQAERWMTMPQNKPAAVDIMAKTMGIAVTEAAIVYEQFVDKLAAIPGEADIDQAGVRGVVELLGEIDAAGNPRPDPARLTDTTYLQRAKASAPRP